MWTCPKCATKVDPTFEVCWRCGTSPEGVEDPSFILADDAGPLEDPVPVADDGTTIEMPQLGAGGLVPCYQALSLMEAKFLANQLIEQDIPAISDTQDMQDALGSWDGNPRVYCRSVDLERARAWLAEYEQRRRDEHG